MLQKLFKTCACIFLVIAGSASALAAHGDWTTQCEEHTAPRTYQLCLSRSEGSTNNSILYLLHGGKGSAHSWENAGRYPEKIRRAWSETHFDPPTVVTISLGPFWILTQKNNRAISGSLEEFVEQIMPYVEIIKLRGQVISQRMLLGESLGGYNVTQLVLRHGGLFRRAAILCPAITRVGPYDSAFEIVRFVNRTGANPRWVAGYMSFLRGNFPDHDSWLKSGSALAAAPSLLSNQSPELYVSCGRQDDFGFYEGAREFAAQAASRGAKVEWEELGGGHCAVNAARVASFLAAP